MKVPRVSVGAGMAAMIVIAIDCVAMRSINQRPDYATELVKLVVLGTLPMANVLTVGIVRLMRDGRRSTRFLRGFVAAGCGALAAYVACLLLGPNWLWLDWYAVPVLDVISEASGLGTSPLWADIEEVVLAPFLLLLPQLVVALAGGWVVQKIGRRPVQEPLVAVGSLRGRAAWFAILLIAIMLPALVIEAYLQWTIDSRTARLAPGTIAVLKTREPAGFLIIRPDGSTVLLPNGARVRVDTDSDAVSLARAGPRGGAGIEDLRRVQVTILDGKEAGQTVDLMRDSLRPVR